MNLYDEEAKHRMQELYNRAVHERFMEIGEATAQGFQAGIKQGELTVKVSYNGFTGELVKLERAFCNRGFYELSIWDAEKKVTHSFSGVNLKDVKFLGGSVSFE